MTVALLAYAALAGIAVVEGLRVAFGQIGPQRRLAEVQAALRAFRLATDDDARQRLIMQAGVRTLSLSLLLFVTLVSACSVMALPLFGIPMVPAMFTAYTAVLSVAGFGWWRLRRSQRPSR